MIIIRKNKVGRFFLHVAVLFLISSLALSVLACVNTAFISVVPEKAQEIAAAKSVVYLDVRTASEYVAGHIAGAVNLGYRSDDFERNLASLDKSIVYIVYCHSGTRSKDTLKIMWEMQFKEAYDIKGGITAWKNAGYPVAAF